MGTGPFAVPAFRQLLQSPSDQVAGIITRPARKAKGRTKLSHPVAELAVECGLPHHSPEDINSPAGHAIVAAWNPDLLVVCDYGQILSSDTLALATRGGINLHGSLLPKYRGAAPVNWAIYHGDAETGVTVIHMTPKLDGGPCLAVARTAIGAEETAAELEPRLAQLGVAPVMESVERLRDWDGQTVLGELQDPGQATRAPRLKKSDGHLDWSRSASEIVNQYRAFQPWPAVHCEFPSKRGPLRLILSQLRPASPLPENAGAPGTVVRADDALWVACGQGAVAIGQVQPAGKRMMPAEEFLRGHPLRPGQPFAVDTAAD